jgi:hypothetical protein
MAEHVVVHPTLTLADRYARDPEFVLMSLSMEESEDVLVDVADHALWKSFCINRENLDVPIQWPVHELDSVRPFL